MATGNDMMMEAVKLVDGIVGELRGFDDTPPPKKVWLDIADRLEKAFGQYRDATMSFINGINAKMEDQVGNVGKLRNILSRVHDWLGVLIRDGRPDDRCSQCIGASDLADDVYDALHQKGVMA